MKSVILIILSFLFILGCSNKSVKRPTHASKLFDGTYYSDERNHSDTLVFQSKKPLSRLKRWSMMVWEISQDSIIRQDYRGLLSFFGEANCTYTLKSNLLTLKYESGFGKYKVVKSTKNRLELIELTTSTYPRKDHDVRSDIQLR